MSGSRSVLDVLFASIERIKQEQSEVTDPEKVAQRMRLVQELVARLPHKYLLAATKEEIQAAGRTMMLEGRRKGHMKALQTTLVSLLDLLWQEKVLPRHPLRPNQLRRSLNAPPPEAVLAVALPDEIVKATRSLVSDLGIIVHQVSSAEAGIDRMSWFPFSFILVRYPIPAPAEFFKFLRSEKSLCRSAGAILLARDDRLESANIFLGRGVNRTLGYSQIKDELNQVLSRLSTISERTRIRVPVIAFVAEEQLSWQSENVSRTGMLVHAEDDLEAGVEVDLEFKLPNSKELVQVAAEVVRRTTFGREDFNGLGLRFLSFRGEGQHAIESFMRRGS